MFLNHRPLLVLFLFLAASPVDVLSRVLSSDANPDGFPDYGNGTLSSDPLFELFPNPLHLLCPVCSLLQFLLGGLLGSLLGGGLVKQLGIFACSLLLSTPLKIPFLPNIICTVVFEIIAILSKKTKSGICPLLLLCPKSKKGVTTTKKPFLTTEEEYESRIVSIIENEDTANLSPQMEYFYRDLIDFLPLQPLKGSAAEQQALQVIRNLVAAIEYHVAHRSEYLAAIAKNVE
ncbi:unnamed protein product [Caenorhabditis sp. 36 PRJEB53466]|nr:unnamed protein product [Caenorhabditis sp. 36 PRJEB53466]